MGAKNNMLLVVLSKYHDVFERNDILYSEYTRTWNYGRMDEHTDVEFEIVF